MSSVKLSKSKVPTPATAAESLSANQAASQSPGAQARQSALVDWAHAALQGAGIPAPESYQLSVASDDASFRRYFRAVAADQSYIFVDAPPDKEDSRPFVAVQALLAAAGLQVPNVYAADLAVGFMMLADFGNTLYLDRVVAGQPAEVDALYQAAMKDIFCMQQIDTACDLPAYDEAKLRSEMALFEDWFLVQQLGLELDESGREILQRVLDSLAVAALTQPQVFVHRDYHSRNLMVLEGGRPGIIDFQDAVVGPLTYDLVSLLKDCYYRFPRHQVVQWVDDFYQQWAAQQSADVIDAAGFLRWFDLMGMQRHLKCAGIFSRLNLRDGKARYLSDIPLVLAYILEVSSLYPEFSDFGDWLTAHVVPRMADKNGSGIALLPPVATL
jgi:aminoglycoside/choline kinase family phosphotransferase